MDRRRVQFEAVRPDRDDRSAARVGFSKTIVQTASKVAKGLRPPIVRKTMPWRECILGRPVEEADDVNPVPKRLESTEHKADPLPVEVCGPLGANRGGQPRLHLSGSGVLQEDKQG
ncbi:MAG: hypothetical protein L0Z62_02410 [Gemmataceae bacterium]|nr:hypothetical protein [Gemmataceae bacterium]